MQEPSEIRYEELFAAAAEGIVIADLETMRFCYANPAMCRMFGYTEEELMRLGVADIHPKDSLDHVKAEFEAQVRGEKTLANDLPCLRKGGTLFYANVSAAPIILGGRKCNMGFFTDVTEQKKAEAALKEAKAFIESALNAIDDIFYAFDLNGKFLSWNKPFGKVSGYSDEELSSKKPTDFFSGEDIQRISEAIGAIFKNGSSKQEADFVLKDGRRLPYEFTGSVLKDGLGNIIGFSGTGRDLTNRKMLEKELQSKIKGLETFNKIAVGRELKMIELKKKIKELEAKLEK